MNAIAIERLLGDFAEDKDAAARIREEQVRPAVAAGEVVVIDFDGVGLTTQSFIHALISDVLRSFGERALEQLEFKNCNTGVRGIIETVVQYSLESVEED
ncbi:MAG: STAS-like domain-containing protein [Deferrisomatales bacterium]